MRCNNCLRDYDDRLDACPYCGNKSKSKGLDVKPVIKKEKRDKLPLRKRITDFLHRNVGHPSPVIIAGLLVLALTSAAAAIPHQPQEAPRRERPQEVDLSDKIHQATAEARTFSLDAGGGFSMIDSQKQLHSYRITESEAKEYDLADLSDEAFSMVQYSFGSLIGVKKSGEVCMVKNYTTRVPQYSSEISTWQDIAQVAVYFDHMIGLKRDGTAVAAGFYDDYFTADEDGYYREYRHDTSPLHVSGWKDMQEVITADVTIGLRRDGTVISTEDGIQEARNIAALSQGCNPSTTSFKKKDGTLTQVEQNDWQEAAKWGRLVEFCVSDTHMVGLMEDGTVTAVGENGSGECEVSEWRDIVAVQATSGCTVGKRADGTFVIATNNKELERSFNRLVNGADATAATADESAEPSAAGDMLSAIENASREEKTFAIGESSFTFINSGGQVHRFEIKDTAVSEVSVADADNQGYVSLEFSPRANGAGFGIKNDGSVTVLSNGASGVYNYEAALGFLTNIQDIVSFEDEVTFSNGKREKMAEIIGLRKDGTIADVVLRENDDTAVLHPTYDKWKDLKSITVNYLVAVGLNKDGTISEIGTPEEFKDYTDIAAIPQGDIYPGGKVFLKSDGTLLQKSDTAADSAELFSDRTGFVAFCDNGHFTIGIKKDGTAVVSKSRDDHKAPDLSDWKNIVAVQANDSFVVGKAADGSFVMAASDTTLKNNFEKAVNPNTQ